VVEYRTASEPLIRGEDDVLTCDDVIPEFQLPIRDALAD
jgi:hypothetical protein